MPARWFIPLGQVDPQRVRSHYLHAAVTRWFDHDPAAHAAMDKPYAVSPLTGDPAGPDGAVGIEVGTHTDSAQASLMHSTQPGATIRLGNQIRHVGRPRLIHRASWAQLIADPAPAQWTLQFETPVTFRTGNRSTPLPDTGTILSGLARLWQRWSPIPLEEAAAMTQAAWVSDLDLRSVVVRMPMTGKDGKVRELVTSGSLGTLTLRCDEPRLQPALAALSGLAAYSGVGSMTLRGLGVTRVTSHHVPSHNSSMES